MQVRKVWRRVLLIGALTALALVATAGAAFADTTYSIQGHVGHISGDWDGAAISAVPYSVDASGSWHTLSGSAVATDGTYSIDGLAPGTYRIGFTDSNLVYGEVYYSNAATVGVGTNVTVVSSNVSSIDQTVTALPTLQITGTAHMVGAPAVSGDVQAEIYSQDASGTWGVVYTTPVNDNGTYDVHVSTAGTYHVGFSDTSNLFGDAFYSGASTVESATNVPVAAGVPATGISATLTASVSRRFSGGDSIGTSVQVSRAQFADGVGGPVVICTADNWPDSLAAAPFAAALNCPILLVHKNSVRSDVITEIHRLDADEAIVIGGSASVSVNDEMALRSAGISVVRRLAGNDRYGTSVAIAQEMLNRGLVTYDENGNLMNVAVASGENYTDAMCGAPAAAAQQMPLLLIQKKSVPTIVRNFLAASETSATQVIAFGGTGSLATNTLKSTAIAPASGVRLDNVTRIGDSDAARTSVAIADYEMNTLGWSSRIVMLANNNDYADGMSVGPLLAANHEALLLTAPALKSVKVAHSPKPYGYTHLSPATEVFISKQQTPVIDPAGVGYSTADGSDYSNVLRDGSVARIDALGDKGKLSTTVWNFALNVAQIPH